MKLYPTLHALEGYIEHVRPCTPAEAEKWIRLTPILFTVPSRCGRLTLFGFRDQQGRKFIGVSEDAYWYRTCRVTLTAIHQRRRQAQ